MQFWQEHYCSQVVLLWVQDIRRHISSVWQEASFRVMLMGFNLVPYKMWTDISNLWLLPALQLRTERHTLTDTQPVKACEVEGPGFPFGVVWNTWLDDQWPPSPQSTASQRPRARPPPSLVDSWISLTETSRETQTAVSPPPKQWTKQRVVALSHYICGWYVPQQRIADTPCSSGKRAQTQKPCMSIEITKERRSYWLSFSSVLSPSEIWTSA